MGRFFSIEGVLLFLKLVRLKASSEASLKASAAVYIRQDSLIIKNNRI